MLPIVLINQIHLPRRIAVFWIFDFEKFVAILSFKFLTVIFAILVICICILFVTVLCNVIKSLCDAWLL